MSAALGEVSEEDLEGLYEVNAVDYEYCADKGMQETPETEVDVVKFATDQVKRYKVF